MRGAQPPGTGERANPLCTTVMETASHRPHLATANPHNPRRLAVTLVIMPRFMTRLLGLLLLTLAITVSSCQAVFPGMETINAPQQLNPGFGTDGR